MTPQECPRYESCNASICPIDPVVAVHLPGEKVCYYLLASGKSGAAGRFADDPAFPVCVARLPEIRDLYPQIGKTVERASRSGFPGANLSRLRGAEAAPEVCETRVTMPG